MKLAMRVREKRHEGQADADPREGTPAEIIDLASRMSYPVVARPKDRSDSLGLVAGIAVVAVLGAATLWGLNSARVSNGKGPARALPVASSVPAAYLPPVVAAVPPTLTDPRGDQPATRIMPGPGMSNAQAINPVTAGNPYASPAVVFDSSALPMPVKSGGNAASAQTQSAPNGSDFASRVGGVGGGTATARADVDPKTTVPQGTMIAAVLETAINTDVPGFARAVVSQDVRSFDGSRVLVPRSSRVIGQYQSGLQAGQKRAYVIWTRLIRPDGVSVALASPASAFDGSGGLPGQVDSHFFQRFGSAILLSVIGGLSSITSGGASLVVGGGQSAASTALQQNGQISPTVRVRMGEPIRVFTARDLDFSQAPRL